MRAEGARAALLLLVALFVGRTASWAGPAPQADPELCQACHEDLVKKFAGKRHAKQNCAACHSTFEKHTETAEPKDVSQPADKACLSCHRGGAIRGSHAGGQTSCAACHSSHGDEPSRGRAAVNQQCTSCHAGTRAEFLKPHRHGVPENAMTCLDCHNPHGQTLARVAKPLFNEPGCFSCHADKRGPFAFEHAPVRTEGCAACHEPHGSANPRMLTRPEVRLQCLECHSGTPVARDVPGGSPPAFHDLRSQRYRNCTACHSRIHGSHVNRSLLR